MPATQEDVIEYLKGLTMIEAVALTRELEKTFGVSAIQQSQVIQNISNISTTVEEEQTEFSVILENSGVNKINVIKEVRGITQLGLKEAKDLVDQAPMPVKENVSKEEAEQLQARLEAAGAKVLIK